jgi:hypothetical protein
MTYGFKFINEINSSGTLKEELVLDDSVVKPWLVKDPNGTIPYGLNYKNVNVTDEYNWGVLGQPYSSLFPNTTWSAFALYYTAPLDIVTVGTYTLPSSSTTDIWYATHGVENFSYVLKNTKSSGPMIIPPGMSGGNFEYIDVLGGAYPFFIIHAIVPNSWLATATTEQINAAIPKVYIFGFDPVPNADLSSSYLTSTTTYGMRLFNEQGKCTYDSNKPHIKIENYSFPRLQTPGPTYYPGQAFVDYNGRVTISESIGLPANANTATFQIPCIMNKAVYKNGSDLTLYTFKTFFKRTNLSTITSTNFNVSSSSLNMALGLPDFAQGLTYFSTGSETIDSGFSLGEFQYATLMVIDSAALDPGYIPGTLPASYVLTVTAGDGTSAVSEEVSQPYTNNPGPNARVRFTLNTSGVPNGTLVPYTLTGTGITTSDISMIIRTGSGSALDFQPISLTGSFYVYNGVAIVDIYIADDNIIEGTESLTMTLNNNQTNISIQILERKTIALFLTGTPTIQYTDNYAEGTTVTVTLKTANIPNGTLIPYTISGTNITSADINGASLTGYFTVNTGGSQYSHGIATLPIVLSADTAIEGNESLIITIPNNSYYGSISDLTKQFTIVDGATYRIYGPNGETSGPIDVVEGSTYTFTVQTSGVTDGTRIYPRFDAPNTVVLDDITDTSWFDKTTSTYTGILVNNNAASFSVKIVADSLTEGTEYFNVYLDTSPGTNQVASWGQVNILDTSLSATYTITPTASNITEGGTVYYNVYTTNVADGTTLYWGNTGSTDAADFTNGLNNGTITISEGYALITRTLKNDYITEGVQTIIMNLYTDSNRTNLVKTATTVNVNDGTFIDEVLNIVPTSVQYNQSFVFTITGGIAYDTVYWSTDGTGYENSLTLDENGEYYNGTAGIGYAVGTHTIYIKFNTTQHLRNKAWTVTPAIPTYSIIPSTTSLNETNNRSVTYTITTTNVTDGTTLYWTNTGTADANDFTDYLNQSTVVINSNTGSFIRTVRTDALTEGTESLAIRLDTGYYWSNNVANATTVYITDTSLSVPTYSLSKDVTSVNEPGTITYTVTTTDVPNNTYLYWINYGTTNAADFTTYTNQGSVLIYNNTGTFTRSLRADTTSEGSETVYIFLYSDSEYSNFVTYTTEVTVNDTSTTPVYTESNYISGASTVTYPSGVDMYWSGGYPNGTVYYELNALATTSSATFGLSPSGTGHNPTAGANLPAGNYTLYCLYAETGHRTSLSFTILAVAPTYPAAGTTNGGQYCSGYTLYQNYNDGSGGTYASVVAYNSPTCGYVAPSGPVTSAYSSATNDGNVELYGSPSVTYDALRCKGMQRINLDMYVQRTFTLNQAATITAYLTVNSESGYDFGEMYFDGVLYARGSGSYSSGAISGPITAGTHTVKCRFTTDGSVNPANDNAFVEYVIS